MGQGVIPVILSGGAGTRLWPLSRKDYPKQFLPLLGEQSLLQSTVRRAAGLTDVADPIFICNESHRFLLADQLQELDCQNSMLLLEPVGRSTAPAAALAAMQALAMREVGDEADPLLLVLPSDHVIADEVAFQQAVAHARDAAQQQKLVTFGIVPTQAETGYGYIQAAKNGEAAHQVLRFVEKPDKARAQAMIDEGGYFWNSGMFLFSAQTYLAELKQHAPQMYACCEQVWQRSAATATEHMMQLDAESFAACPEDSIDFAVMERTRNAAVVPLDAGWSDVGAWSTLSELSAADEAGNVLKGDVLTENVKGSYIQAHDRLIAAIGVEDHIIVETADAVLIAHKDECQKVKHIVQQLKQADRPEATHHSKVYRPWGSYETLALGPRFQVKRIFVRPGAALSLQMHHHRSEHWVVVAGTARVTRGEEQLVLTENESTFIPLGVKHRLENIGKIPLEIIEIQSGSYLGEDDIVRFEDVYGRLKTEDASSLVPA